MAKQIAKEMQPHTQTESTKCGQARFGICKLSDAFVLSQIQKNIKKKKLKINANKKCSATKKRECTTILLIKRVWKRFRALARK